MGNCFVLRKCVGNSSCAKAAASCKDKKAAAKTLKADHVEKATPMLVKDLLTDFSCWGVGLSKKSSNEQHPCSSLLKLAKTYNSVSSTSGPGQSSSSGSVVSGEGGSEKRRIKVVITKQQLQELLSKQEVSLGDLLSGFQNSKASSCTTNHDSTHCKPKLEPIPEEKDEFTSDISKSSH